MNDGNNIMMLPIGTLLQNGKYRIERYMGSGGFGNTYEVIHTKLKRRFALKEFFLSGDCLRSDDMLSVTVSNPTKAPLFSSMREKFEKEAQRMYDLTEEGCPNVVRITDLFDENQTSYYVMELIEGESLGKRLKQSNQPLTEQEVMNLLPQILEALNGVHRHNIWHLDLKPDNLMVNNKGHLTLIDFGASKQMSASGGYSQTLSAMCYTPGYAPSEQMDQNIDKIGPWTDIYSLGATIYRLLTNTTPPLPSEVLDDERCLYSTLFSPQMQSFILWLMKPRRQDRPQSIADIQQWLFNEQTVISEATIHQPDEKTRIVNPDKTVYGSQLPQQPVLPPIIQGIIDNMVFVKGGTFRMGTESKGWLNNLLSDIDSDECPAHDVKLSDFYMGKFQVTQQEWEAVMGNNPSKYKGGDHPVENVSWNDCQNFITKLNKITGKKFRLPTEAEWEYAARGGMKSQGYKYAGSNFLKDIAWHYGNINIAHEPVGKKLSNELGLYDMLGNVWEWCNDWYGKYSPLFQTNPQGASMGSGKVCRGGGWDNSAAVPSVSKRNFCAPKLKISNRGLRLACDAE